MKTSKTWEEIRANAATILDDKGKKVMVCPNFDLAWRWVKHELPDGMYSVEHAPSNTTCVLERKNGTVYPTAVTFEGETMKPRTIGEAVQFFGTDEEGFRQWLGICGIQGDALTKGAKPLGTCYVSELNCHDWARTGSIEEHEYDYENESHFAELHPDGSMSLYGKGYAFRSRETAEKVNELLRTEGYQAARAYARQAIA